jgi:hypothetical protein
VSCLAEQSVPAHGYRLSEEQGPQGRTLDDGVDAISPEPSES